MLQHKSINNTLGWLSLPFHGMQDALSDAMHAKMGRLARTTGHHPRKTLAIMSTKEKIPGFSERLMDIKERRRKTYGEIGDDTGIPLNTIRQIGAGHLKISPRVADKICDAYPEVSREWLLTGNGSKFVDGYVPAARINDGLDGWDASQLRVLLREKEARIASLERENTRLSEMMARLLLPSQRQEGDVAHHIGYDLRIGQARADGEGPKS